MIVPFENLWKVLTQDNRTFGIYPSKEIATLKNNQLQQFEELKYKKAKRKIFLKMAQNQVDEITYSSTMRKMRLEYPEKVKNFQKSFHKAFKDAINQNLDQPSEVALLASLEENN